ncbi:MAG: LCP family protein [Acidimicrobiales bacterium]
MSTDPRRLRRTWPQRLLLVAGVALAAICFVAAQAFWDAQQVLSELPRIRVGPDILATSGGPGDPVNFLLVGVDSSEGLDPDDPVRQGRDLVAEADGRFLSDTILLMRLDPATGDAAVLSIPRDLYVQVPGSSEWKINSTLLIGGMDTLIETIDENLDIPINHFVMVDFAGFSNLVELVGGVPVYFPFPTRDLGSGLAIADSGCWVLDGPQALAYVRARSIEEMIDGEWTRLAVPAPDLARIERQQEFMVLALEEALKIGGSDIGRIREFVDVGTQAVQLDERLTPGELLDLASAFSEYDTEALQVATLPVAALFADDGRYLGEQLVVADATGILEVFRGLADGVRPADVTVLVSSADSGQQERTVDQLVERGFGIDAVGDEPVEPVQRTTIRFAPDDRETAMIVARYLEVVPAFVADPAIAGVRLDVGPDFAGVRSFPRPVTDVRPAVVRAVDAIPSRQPVTPTTTLPGSPTSVVPSVTGDDGSVTTSTPATTTTADVSNGPTIIAPSTSTIVRGRPPEGVGCSVLGG